jgi:phage shock protein C
MINCPKCNKQNKNDSKFCNYCGIKIDKNTSESDFEKNIEHFGEEIEKISKKIGKAVEEKGKNVETWYDKTFGLFGPVLSGLIAFIIILSAIRLMLFFGNNRPFLMEIGSFLEPLMLIILFIILISSFSQYLTKKIRPFRYISPIVGAVIFIFWFWIALNILAIIGVKLDISVLITFSDFFEILIIPIALLILIIGYLGLITSSQFNKSAYIQTDKKTNEHPDEQTKDFNEIKRLYRSGKEKIIAGVLGGLADYLKIDPVFIRVLFVIMLIFSFGFMILAYLISWIIIPRNPNHNW